MGYRYCSKLLIDMTDGIGQQLAQEEKPEAVRQELARVIASPYFKDADRLVRSLNFVVVDRLEGRGASLKESVIGVEVFDRPAGYDPKVDPIVKDCRHSACGRR